jgi:hypothetical protein
MVEDSINKAIIENEGNPFPDMDGATYLNKDYWLLVMQGKMDLKMLQCIDWSRDPRYDATPEELYAIAPNYDSVGRKYCYGMGKNKVTQNPLYLPSPDHKIPITQNGPKTIDNIVIIPLIYNIWKRDMLKEDWIAYREFMDSHLLG